MSRIMFIDGSHREQIRVAVTEKGRVTEFDIESFDKKQTIGNIYLAKVTRVEPSLQAAFVEYGSGRQGFLSFSEIHPDYYQIPLEDRKRLLEEAAAFYNSDNDDDDVDADIDNRGINSDDTFQDSFDADNNDLDNNDSLDVSAYRTDDNHVILNNGTHSDGDDDFSHEDSDITSDESVSDNPNNRTKKSYVKKPRLPRYKIQEVIKKRQILLVQVIKSERGNKGAALTTYLSLAGRYCVLMPNTARGGGISRKITNVADRQKLRSTIKELELPTGMGLIVRTAGLQRTKVELRRDYEYLLRLWDNVRQLTMTSTAPALVYEEGDLIKRALRDIYTRDTGKIFVQGEAVFKETRDIMKMIMPSVVRFIHHYHDPVPLFSRYQIERQLDELSSPQVTLKSGGYLVINHTEALIAIDVNSGKSTNSYSVEETALRTNLEAGEEIARQLRLRDLAGLIVIDFIDMEDYNNVRTIERKMRDFLRHDKARLQIAPISTFGLMEMTRQRLRPAMKDLMSVPCDHCQGMGFVLSLETSALRVLRAIFEEISQKPIAEVSVTCTIDIAHYLLNKKRKELLAVEQEYDLVIHINGSSKYARLEYDIETTLKDLTQVTRIPKAYQEEDYEEQILDPETELETPSEGGIADDASENTPRGRLRDNKRRRPKRADKSDTEDALVIEQSDDTIPIEKTPHKRLNHKHDDRRSKFNRKRGRFDIQLSETADIFVTASGNEVIIENRVSVRCASDERNTQKTEIKPDISPKKEVSLDTLDVSFDSMPEQVIDNVIVENRASAQMSTQTTRQFNHVTYTAPQEDGDVLVDHIDKKPIKETIIDDKIDKTVINTNITQTYIDDTPLNHTPVTDTFVCETPACEEQKSARRGWWRNRFGCD